MSLVNMLKTSELKAKALSSLIAKKLLADGDLIESLGDEFELLDNVEKGIMMEALEYATDVDPEVVEPALDVVVDCLKCEAPKVKWEAARVIGNIAGRFPEKASRSVPRLLENSKHKGTVVRWSAAYALGEIVKANEEIRSSLVLEIDKILRREKNNGVKNVYVKALKAVR